MTRMNNFFCGLHYLVGLAESTDKTLSMWELSLLSDNSTQTLVCTVCKAFWNVLMDSMWCDEREKLFKAARSLAPSFKTFKARRQEIESRQKKDIKKRIEDNVRKELDTIKEKESLTKKIQESGGLWTKEEKLENGLACCQHKEEERGS